MFRRLAPPHILLAAYCGGLAASLAGIAGMWPAVAGALAIATAAVALRLLARRPASPAAAVLPVALTILFVAVGLLVGADRLARLQGSALEPLVGRSISLGAVLTDLPAIDDDQVTLAVTAMSVDGRPVREPAHLRLKLDDGQRFALDACGPLVEGAVLRLDGVRVASLPEAEEGEFDYGRFLRRRGEHVTLEAPFAALRIVGRRGGLQGLVDRLRLASRAHLRAGLHGQVAEVLQGMVLGDDEGVDQQPIDDFRRSGLLHIMAVSGENVVLLCGMWSFAFSLLRIPRLARTALLVPVVITYVLLTGASPSIVRAGIAGVVGLLAILASRPSDGWLLWLAPAAWLLTINPNTVFDVSFQLSFGAVAGLLVLARPLTKAFAFLPGPLPEQIGVTTAASISTAPVSMLTFGSASLVSVPANLVGGFVLGPIMFFGMLSLLLGFVTSWLSVPLNLLAGLFIGFLLDVARVFGRLSWAVYEWQGLSLGFLLAVSLAIEAVVIAVLANRCGRRALDYVTARRRSLLMVTAVLIAAVVLLAPAAPAAPARPTLTLLSVGEGAAALLQVPHGPTVLIDAGPAPLRRVLHDHGVRRIDLLVLSHGHADHAAGLQDVLGRVPIARALLPRPPEPSGALDALAAELTAAGTAVGRCTSPLRVRGEGWSLDVLPTAPPGGEGGNQGENDAALVALATLGGQRVLVPGDAEGEVLAELHVGRCAVVELPHHGSRGGLDEALLHELAPRLAVISVGPNKYGHPTADMLDMLASLRVLCLRTDRGGDVAIWTQDGELRVARRDGG